MSSKPPNVKRNSGIRNSGLLITRTLRRRKHQLRDFFNRHACLQQRLSVARHRPSMWSILDRRLFSFGPTLSIQRNQDYVSKKFERWKELASLTSREQD